MLAHNMNRRYQTLQLQAGFLSWVDSLLLSSAAPMPGSQGTMVTMPRSLSSCLLPSCPRPHPSIFPNTVNTDPLDSRNRQLKLVWPYDDKELMFSLLHVFVMNKVYVYNHLVFSIAINIVGNRNWHLHRQIQHRGTRGMCPPPLGWPYINYCSIVQEYVGLSSVEWNH